MEDHGKTRDHLVDQLAARSTEGSRRSEATARAFLESAAEGIVIVGRDGGILLANAKTEELFGYHREELLGQPVEVLLPERLRSAHIGHRAAYFADPRVRPMGVGLDLAGRHKDGTEFPVEISLSYVTTEDGVRAMAFITDISERRKAEEKLRDSEAKSRAILDTVVDGIITIDEQGIVQSFNPAAGRIFGFAPSEVIGQNVRMLMPEPYHSEHDGYLANYQRTGEKKIIGIGREVAGRHKDGTIFPVDIAVSEVRLADRRIFTGIVRDITERKRAEEALARQAQELLRLAEQAHVREAFIRNVVESIQDGIIVLDRQGWITEWNSAMEERYGIPAAEVRGLAILEVFPSLKAEGFEESLARILEENQEIALGRVEHEARHRGRVTMNIKGSPLRTLTGEVIGAVLALEDVTERIQLERIARQSEKMAAVGTLAAGIAHEINNPIGIITSRVELMLMEAREKALAREVIKDLQVIEKHAGRVAKITQGLLSFSRQAPWKLTAVDVNLVIEEALLLVEKQLAKEQIVLKKNLAPDLPKIPGSPNHLEQVLVNLLTNAREAMTDGGMLSVSTSLFRPAVTDPRIAEGHLSPQPSVLGDSAVEIRITDTGPGIPPEVHPRIFDPFFTTKEQGTGLGLSISYGIVREHGGTITVESRPGEGSTFIIQLPIGATSGGEGTIYGERADPRH